MDPNRNNPSRPPKKDDNTPPNSQLPKGRGLFPTGLGNFKKRNPPINSSLRGGTPPQGASEAAPQASQPHSIRQESALSRPGIAPRLNPLNRPVSPKQSTNAIKPGANPSPPANTTRIGASPSPPANAIRPGVNPSYPSRSVQPVASRSPLPQGSPPSPQGKASSDFEEFRKQKLLQQNLSKTETPSPELEPEKIISSDRFQRSTEIPGGMEKKEDRYSLRNDIKAGGLANRERAEKVEGLKGKGKGYQDHRLS